MAVVASMGVAALRRQCLGVDGDGYASMVVVVLALQWRWRRAFLVEALVAFQVEALVAFQRRKGSPLPAFVADSVA